MPTIPRARHRRFMHVADPHQELLARRLVFDHKRNHAHMDTHRKALGSAQDPNALRSLSFAMTQGSFTAFSRPALTRLLAYTREAEAAREFLGVADRAPHGLLRSARAGTCLLPTDVGLGWLATHAFAGRPLAAVNLFALFEVRTMTTAAPLRV